MIGAVAVIGGGIAGVQAALDLADNQLKVYLIEKRPGIGGRMAQLDKTFPTNDCSICILSPKLVRAARHPNIEIMTCAEALGLEGEAGDLSLRVRRNARYVDVEKCTACGACVEKCPVEVPREFDEGLSQRRAIYFEYAQAVPNAAAIDPENCLRLTKGRCGLCAEACPTDAIDYVVKDEEIELRVGAVVVATGFDPYDPSPLGRYQARSPDVLTSLEFERLLDSGGPTDGKIVTSNGDKPRHIAFIQCVGSRERGFPVCSTVCCMSALKEAMLAREHDINTSIFGVDLRCPDKDFEEYYHRAKGMGVRFVRSRPSEAWKDEDEFVLRWEDQELGELKETRADLVVLSVGMRPSRGTSEVARALDLETDGQGFIKAVDGESSVPGVFVAGAAEGPKDIPSSVVQASAAASRVISLLGGARGTLAVEKEYPPEKPGVEDARVGVFVCHCGTNIAGTVDVERVAEHAQSLDSVEVAEDILYACSEDGLDHIKERIQGGLTRVVVASCTPRTHEALFQEMCREAGLNPYLFEFANIREQCAWVHRDRGEATEKAKNLVTAAVGRAKHLTPLYRQTVPVTGRALVVGGDLAAQTAALDLAEKDVTSVLVSPHEVEVDGVTVYSNARITGVDGYVGNYTARIATDTGEHRVDIGAIIIATGAMEHEPSSYGYGRRDVFTLEDAAGGVEGGDVVYVLCVECRDEERVMCGRTCCVESLRQARDLAGDGRNVTIVYRDIRSFGRWERVYEEARERGVTFIRYAQEDPPDVQGNLLQVHDTLSGLDLEIPFDSLVLATPKLARGGEMSDMFKVPYDGFFREAHPKLRPVEFATEGLYLCGDCRYPVFPGEAVEQARAAAAKAYVLLGRGEVEVEASIAHVDRDKCNGCEVCVEVCPYEAIDVRERGVWRYAEVVEAGCNGCGVCAPRCPTGAIQLRHYTSRQVLAQIDGLLGGDV